MRTSIIVFLLAATGAFAASADDTSLAGKWQVLRSAAGNESQLDCTLDQKGTELTGTCDSDRGKVEFSGKVDGKKVTWTHKSDSPGGMVTVVYEGTLESSDKITGKVTAVEFSIEGEFTATRAK